MKTDKLIASTLIILALAGIFLNFAPNMGIGNNNKSNATKAINPNVPVNAPKILAISLNGAIMDGEEKSFLGAEANNAVNVRDTLIKAAQDNNVKGVLIRINSPGGAVGISQEIYQAVMELRKKKPVVASMGDIAASGGYYVASATDIIYANPGTLTGSIGVIIQGFNVSALADKVGIKDTTVKAGKYKDILSMFRPVTAEEQTFVQEIVNDTYDQFVTAVYEGRLTKDDKYGEMRQNLTKEYIASIAEGMIYTGRQASKIGLVDELGGYNDALARLQKMVKTRSKGKIKRDLLVVNSLKTGNSLREILGISALIPTKPVSVMDYALQKKVLENSPVLYMTPEILTR